MKISVVTVCYNSESVIERTLQSVVNQTFGDFEYLMLKSEAIKYLKEIALIQGPVDLYNDEELIEQFINYLFSLKIRCQFNIISDIEKTSFLEYNTIM